MFSVYIDDLFSILRGSGLGCSLYGHFYGCFGYADDLLILSASRSGLQSMINKCSEFMQLKKLRFNTNPNPVKSKTYCIVFSKKIRDWMGVAPVKLNGDNLQWVTELKQQHYEERHCHQKRKVHRPAELSVPGVPLHIL